MAFRIKSEIITPMPPADCDFDDFIYEEECKDDSKQDLLTSKNIPQLDATNRAEIEAPYIIASRPSDYLVSKIFYKKLFNTGKGVKCSPQHYTYYERNQSKKIDNYSNPLFNDWQNEFCDKITNNHNVIAQVATSCGKTWAANLIISYYVLQSNSTALFITPNYEILRDNVSEILEKNHKIYMHQGSHIVDTQTRRFSSYVESGKTKAQILCITADNFISFATNDINHDFIKKLKYIVFDEVHLPEVHNTIKWAGLLPTSIDSAMQYILLSATITASNINVLSRHLSNYSPNEISVISHDIRPIPLQFLYLKKDSTEKNILGQICSISDPTIADIEQITGEKINMIRDEFYKYGQEVIKTHLSDIIATIVSQIQSADLNPIVENLYKLLKFLFKKDMQPVIIFGMSAHSVKEMCKEICKYINYLESIDVDHIALCKKQAHYQKLAEENKARAEKKKGATALDENPEDFDDLFTSRDIAQLNRYKFPNLNEHTFFKPGFEKHMLEYGIGVNVSSTNTKTKNKIFDLFKTGKIKVLFADTSISVGINLPIRTCILTDIKNIGMSYSLFKQMSGRAGRRGHDTVGYVIPMIPEDVVIPFLTENIAISPEINVNPRLNSMDIIKLMTPEVLSNCYYDDPKKKTELDLSTIITSSKVSAMRKKMLEKYMAVFPIYADDLHRSKSIITMRGLHNNIFTNIINSSNEPATIILMEMLRTTDIKNTLKTDIDFIKLIASLIHRIPGDNVILPKESILLIESFDIITGLNEGINPWLVSWYTAKLTLSECIQYIESIEYIGNWLYLLLCHFNKIDNVIEKQSHFKTILLETDRKYINMKKIMGMD